MTRQEQIDLIRLQIHEYFDHYLTEVFPKQVGAIVGAHDKDTEAHAGQLEPLKKAARMMDRTRWMFLGAVAILSGLLSLVGEKVLGLLKG
jgi:hypothetical protein